MQACDICFKKRYWSSTGKFTKDGARIWICRYQGCGHEQAEEPPRGKPNTPLKVLYFDIETSLIEVRQTVWSLRNFNKYINWEDITKDQYVICWAGAWVEDNKRVRVFGDCVSQKEALVQDDKRVIAKLRDALEVADYGVGHNMRSYDWKAVNGRIIVNGLRAPKEPKILDTLSLARRKFRVASHKLEYWSSKLEGNPKDDMNREDWEKILASGDKKSLRKMYKYCKGDIREGVNIFLKFKEFIEDSTGNSLYKYG